MNLLKVLKLAVLAHVGVTAMRAWQNGMQARVTSNDTVMTPETWPGVSVLIPAWNDAVSVQRALPTVFESSRKYAGPVQLLVIAGGKDETFAQAKRLTDVNSLAHVEAMTLPQLPGGKNAALNVGLHEAKHDLLVFLDADTSVDSDWLTELVRPLATGQADATTGNFRPYTPTPVSLIFELEQVMGQQLGQITLFGGGSIAVTREALNRIGGRLPEDVPVGVDYDLSQRLAQAGARYVFCTQARVQTEIAQTWPEYWKGEVRWRRAYLHGQLRHLRQDRNPRRLLGLLYLPALQGALLSGGLLFPLVSRLAGRSARGGLKVWVWLLLWVLGRQAASPLRVYAFTRDTRYLRHTPAYLQGFMVSAAAAWRAVFTIRQLNQHFKGQRPDRNSS